MKPEYRHCFKCDYQAVTDSFACPRCRCQLHTAGKIRFLGFVQMLCGGFITLLIGAIAAAVGWIVVQPDKLAMHNNARDQQQLFVIFGVLALIFALGLTFASAGIWQIIFARRNKFLMWAALILIIVVFGGTEIFVAVLAD